MSVYQQVADKFEQIAGTHAGEQLDESSAPVIQTYALKVSTTQTVEIEPDVQRGTGPLPSYVTVVAGDTSLNAQLSQDLQQLQQQVQRGLQQWAQQDQGTYRRLVANNTLFPSATSHYGYESTCDTCYGRCTVECSRCGGHGTNTCHSCNGPGEVRCGQCDGSKSFRCRSCHGNPVRYESVPESVWSDAQKGYVTTYRQVTHYCDQCNRSGWEHCYKCDTFGRVQCSTCRGRGQLSCQPCGTTGRLDCHTCSATGTLHLHAGLRARIQVNDTWASSIQDPKLLNILSQQVGCDALGGLGILQSAQHAAQGLEVRSDYTLALKVEQSDITYDGASHRVFGLGPQAEIFDYDGLMSKANGMVCQSLENAINAGFPWSRQRIQVLNDAFSEFRSNISGPVLSVDPFLTQTKLQDVVAQSQGVIDTPTAERITTSTQRYAQAMVHATMFPWLLALFVLGLGLYGVLAEALGMAHCGSPHKLRAFLYCIPVALLMGWLLVDRVRRALDLRLYIANIEIVVRQNRWKWLMWAGMASGGGICLAYALDLLWSVVFSQTVC